MLSPFVLRGYIRGIKDGGEEMPTERFYNLPKEKKEIIIKAAKDEFIQVPFEKVSINRIIKHAGISRGSFYTYFEDKHDLLAYIFEDAGDNFQCAWESNARKNHGDLWKTIDSFVEESVLYDDGSMLQLVKNIVDSVQMYGVTNHLCQNITPGQLCMLKVMHESIDKSDFRDQSIETFGMLISTIFFEMAKGLEWYYAHPEDKEKIKEVFRKKLDLLQYGIRKQNLE
jgi:AcrR family transcriptional regulator